MTRRKVRLAWIENDTSRKASFKKRRAGLLKKVKELSILCGVSAFIIVYGPGGAADSQAVWPSPAAARELMERFRRVPEMDRCKKMVNQESYLKERAAKMAEQLRKHHRKNKERMTAYVMRQIGHGKPLSEFETSELSSVLWLLEEKMKEINRRIEYFDQTVLLRPSGGEARSSHDHDHLRPPPLPLSDAVNANDDDDDDDDHGDGDEMVVGSTDIDHGDDDEEFSWEAFYGGMEQSNTTLGLQVQDHESHGVAPINNAVSAAALPNNNINLQAYGNNNLIRFDHGGSGTGNNGDMGFQPYHGNISNNNITVVSANNQMGNFGYGHFGSGLSGGSHTNNNSNNNDDIVISERMVEMGLTQVNHGDFNSIIGGSSSSSSGSSHDQQMGFGTALLNPNFGHNIVGAGSSTASNNNMSSIGPVGTNENVGFGLLSGQVNYMRMGGNNPNSNSNSININGASNINFNFFSAGNDAGVLGQNQEINNNNNHNNKGNSSNGGNSSDDIAESIMPNSSGLFGGSSSSGTSADADELMPYNFCKNWPGLFTTP